MSRHTPGPWHVSESLDGTMTEVMAGPIYIAPAVWQASVGTDNQQQEREANARLIAAAPSLLEALEQIVSEAENEGMITESCIASARALISEAKGGAK